MNQMHDDRLLELAALYALGALPDGERVEIAAHLPTCAACRSEFAMARGSATALLLAADAPPPASLRARALAVASRPSNVAPLRRRAVTWLAAAAAVIALVVFGRQLIQRPERAWSGACSPAGACSAARVVAVDGGLRLDADGMAPAPSGKVYQAWIIPKGGKPIPEPVFDASGGHATVAIPVGAQPGMLVAVTIEPRGGSRAPTTKPFLVAKLD